MATRKLWHTLVNFSAKWANGQGGIMFRYEKHIIIENAEDNLIKGASTMDFNRNMSGGYYDINLEETQQVPPDKNIHKNEKPVQILDAQVNQRKLV